MDEDDVDWDDLRYFARVLRMKTLLGTARSLDVELATVGRRLSALERSIGGALVIRGSEELRLTMLGRSIAPLVHDAECAVTAVRKLAATQRMHVRLAIPTSFIDYFTSNLARLRKEHPDVSLEVVRCAPAIGLKKGDTDLEIRVGPVADDTGLVARTLCSVAARPVVLLYRRELRRTEPIRAVARFVESVVRANAARIGRTART